VGPFVGGKQAAAKPDIYRSDADSTAYLPHLERYAPARVVVTGMYSMPMISHSPEFPISLQPAPLERLLVAIFRTAIALRTRLTGRHGWLCAERNGQAFLVAAQRKA